VVEQPGAEAHVLRQVVPGAAQWVDADDMSPCVEGVSPWASVEEAGGGEEEAAGQAAWRVGRVVARGEAQVE
jgi:hypothetical protein